MFTRPMLFCGVLVASVVVPYVLVNDQLAGTARAQWQRLVGTVRPAEKDAAENPLAKLAGAALASAAGPPIEQALRFDLSPQWVASQWPRVMTVAGGVDELGMRVAWVSGTRGDDVAGSLTYYFDRHHQLARITFAGLTADPKRLMAAVVGPYGLKSQPTTQAAHYVAGDPQQPTSEVIVRHLPVLTSAGAGPRAEISLNLSRGNARTALAPSEQPEPREQEPELKLLPPGYRRW